MSYNENVFRLAETCNHLNNYRVEQIEPRMGKLQEKAALSDAEKAKLKQLEGDWQAAAVLSHFAYMLRQWAQTRQGFELKWLSLREIHEVCYLDLIQMGHPDTMTAKELEEELALVKTSRWGPMLSIKSQGNEKLYRVNILMQPDE